MMSLHLAIRFRPAFVEAYAHLGDYLLSISTNEFYISTPHRVMSLSRAFGWRHERIGKAG